MSRRNKVIGSLCLLAFLLRLAVALLGPDHFWSYTAYYAMANVVAHGGGFCMTPGGDLCSYFPPLYPALLAACILTGHAKIAIIILSSLIGAGTVLLTFLIGESLFGSMPGIAAALYASIYPYYVWHDAVIQENAILAFVVAATILLLIRPNHSSSRWLWMGAGPAAALSILTKANLTVFLILSVFSILLFAPGTRNRRFRQFLWVCLGAMAVLCPWIVRTWRITGTPILYSNAGFSLWTANHQLTFDYFPSRSIDDAAEPEFADFTPEEAREFLAIRDPQGIRQTKWLWKRGVAYIEAHPLLTIKRALYKVWIGFSPLFSPAKGAIFQSVYFLFWMPLFVLAPLGMWRARSQWRDTASVYSLIVGFACSCAVFWGHTSHRMYIEPYLMIFSAFAWSGQSPVHAKITDRTQWLVEIK